MVVVVPAVVPVVVVVLLLANSAPSPAPKLTISTRRRLIEFPSRVVVVTSCRKFRGDINLMGQVSAARLSIK